MGQVDAVYFTKDWQLGRGCKIEREIAKAYGVKILDYDFLEEPKEMLLRKFEVDDSVPGHEWFNKLHNKLPLDLDTTI